MLKLIRYMKPYIVGVLLAVALLYTQVNMDLALPDLMSRIINTGIQQGGISEVLPEVLNRELYQGLTMTMTPEDSKILSEIYSVSEISDNLKDKFPNIDSTSVVIKDTSAEISEDFKLSYSRSIVNLMKIPGTEGLEDSFLTQASININKSLYETFGADLGSIQNSYILHTGLQMLLVTIISAICTISVGYIGAKTAAGIARNIRYDLFKKVESFSSAEFDKFSTASLITRSTNDITQIQNVVFMIVRMVIYAPLMGVGGFIRAMGKAPSMGWLIGLAVVILLLIIGIVIGISMPKFKLVQKMVDRLNLVARENLSGMLVVRAFNRQKFEEDRFDKANKDLTDVNLFVMRMMVIMMPIIMLLMNALSVVIIWVGSHEVALGNMLVGDMMAFIQYAMQIVMSFMMLSMVFVILPRASVSATRIADVLNTKLSITDKPENELAKLNDKKDGVVEFKDVSFAYPGGEIEAIKNISFKATPGTTTAFIGSTGSGKSTIVNLIPRFYDVTKGSITIDGVDIRDISQKELRDNIGFVPQKNVLFSGTIESNLKYGKKDGTKEDLDRATKIAQATEIIESKEEGYNFEVSQGGTNVSGGQRQRLAISRALMKDAPVYVFDDSFSALDFKTDAALRAELNSNYKDSTVIIVAQRVASIMQAEQIIVLDEGVIVGQGTHKELIVSCPQYKEIATSQLGIEEGV